MEYINIIKSGDYYKLILTDPHSGLSTSVLYRTILEAYNAAVNICEKYLNAV